MEDGEAGGGRLCDLVVAADHARFTELFVRRGLLPDGGGDASGIAARITEESAQLLGLGELGNMAANLGTQLLTLKFSREDESEADLVGLELAARAAFRPQASVTLWQKMTAAGGGSGPGVARANRKPGRRIRMRQDQVLHRACLSVPGTGHGARVTPGYGFLNGSEGARIPRSGQRCKPCWGCMAPLRGVA